MMYEISHHKETVVGGRKVMDEIKKMKEATKKFYSEESDTIILRDFRALSGISTGIINTSSDLTAIYETLRQLIKDVRIESEDSSKIGQAVDRQKKFLVEFADERMKAVVIEATSNFEARQKFQRDIVRCGYTIKRVAE